MIIRWITFLYTTVSVSSYTGQKYCQHINSVLYESSFSTIKSSHIQGFRRLMKVLLIMALEDKWSYLTWSSFKHFYINIYKKKWEGFLILQQLNPKYTAFFVWYSFPSYTERNVSSSTHLTLYIYKNILWKFLRCGDNDVHRYPSTYSAWIENSNEPLKCFVTFSLGWNETVILNWFLHKEKIWCFAPLPLFNSVW